MIMSNTPKTNTELAIDMAAFSMIIDTYDIPEEVHPRLQLLIDAFTRRHQDRVQSGMSDVSAQDMLNALFEKYGV